MASDPISVISSDYCVPNPVNLKINTEMGTSYINNNLVFTVEKLTPSLHRRRVMYDASRNLILTLYRKRRTMHGRWNVFNGDSTDKKEMLFSVMRSRMIPLEKNIDLVVFLANHIKGSARNFRVKANSSMTTCDIYVGESSSIIAKMEKKGAYNQVSVEPNIDYAFIVALLMIVGDKKKTTKGKTAANKVGTALAVTAGTMGLRELMEDDEEEDEDEDEEEDEAEDEEEDEEES